MKFLALSVLFILALIPIVAGPQSNSPQSPVEISGEPRHHPKFENQFVRVWDVTVPAGDATLWHIHRHNNVVVVFGDATLRVETAGATPIESIWEFGEVKFGKATYVHRAMNIGTTSFHNLTIELLKSPPIAPQLANNKEPATTPVLENEYVRVYRKTLKPGESTSLHTHMLPRLGITVQGGEVQILTKTKGGDKTERVSLPLGDLRWRSGPVTHLIKNVGRTTFEAIDIELK